jgi:Dyp-type peroxidase family
MLDLPDIQGIVFTGYGHMPYSRFLFLQITDRKAAQAWLTLVLPCIVTGERREKNSPKPHTSAHIALSPPGLQQFGLTQDALDTFPREFTEGMAYGQRPRVLGDTGASDPQNWQFGGPTQPEIHLLLALYAIDEAYLEALKQEAWYPDGANHGLGLILQQDSFRKCDNEPFGFRDGIGQPTLEGNPVPAAPGQAILNPGEFLLGYTNGYDNLSPVPTVSAAVDTGRLLPADNILPDRRAFGLNGSFLVFRKLKQDVAGFWKYFEQKTLNPDGTPNPEQKVLLASKCVGRWPSGAALTLTPEKDDPSLAGENPHIDDFKFAATDLSGFACPIGSHIRRTNPRDALEPNGSEKALIISNRHRIIRRGRPFETPLLPEANCPPTAPGAPPASTDRAAAAEAHAEGNGEPKPTEQGIYFLCINADIQRQFEFIQQTWANNAKFNGLYDNKDPIIGDNDGTGVMVLQNSPVRTKIHDLPRFVEMRGGGYFFLPGLRALRFLAGLP